MAFRELTRLLILPHQKRVYFKFPVGTFELLDRGHPLSEPIWGNPPHNLDSTWLPDGLSIESVHFLINQGSIPSVLLLFKFPLHVSWILSRIWVCSFGETRMAAMSVGLCTSGWQFAIKALRRTILLAVDFYRKTAYASFPGSRRGRDNQMYVRGQ